MHCPRCSAEVPSAFRYCGHCGCPMELRQVVAAERRQLTVMFCDLVGSTALSARLDPEELVELVRTYHGACVQAVERFEGHVAQYLGDGLLVYFGFPVAHEDSPGRAVRAALAVLEELEGLRGRGEALSARIGIHTGLVVVGEVGFGTRRETLALGDTPNLAARLQGRAEPGTVLISGATLRLLHGDFETQSLGRQVLRGLGEVEVHRVLGLAREADRAEGRARLGRLPFVGREEELTRLRALWDQAREGSRQALFLVGEAGIGKTRLLRAFREGIEGPVRVLGCHGSPYHRDTPFRPLAAMLEGLAEGGYGLRRLLAELGLDPGRHLPPLSELLGVAPPEPGLTPHQRKHRLLDSVVHLVLALAREKPLLLVVEDAFWVDPSTLEALDLLVRQSGGSALMVVVEARQDFALPWEDAVPTERMLLHRLQATEVAAMLEAAGGEETLPSAAREELIERADGVPLFVEELARTLLEAPGPGAAPAIPASVQDLLMARLDRLGPSRETAQVASVLGREFEYRVLQEVVDQEPDLLKERLGRLVLVNVLRSLGEASPAYVFRQGLIQEAAYHSLLKRSRQEWHARVAEAMVARFPDMAEQEPEVVARHFAEAGRVFEALEWWQKAAARAVRRSAVAEAARHLGHALDLTAALPAGPERDRLELLLHTQRGPVLMALRGYAADEVEAAYARAGELVERAGEAPELFPILWGQWAFHLVRARFAEASRRTEEMGTLAERTGLDSFRLETEVARGATLLWEGRFNSARRSLEAALALYRPGEHARDALVYGQEPGTVALANLSWVTWFLGEEELALDRAREAWERARAAEHPYSLAYAMTFAGALHRCRGDVEGVRRLAGDLVELAREHGFPLWMALGLSLDGWALTASGDPTAGMWRIHQGLETYRATGAELSTTFLLASMADACRRAGRTREGLDAARRGLEASERTGERVILAELLTLRGELLSGSGSPPEPVEESLRLALDVAGRQKSPPLQARAAAALARWLAGQGRREEARRLLATAPPAPEVKAARSALGPS